MGIPRHMSFFFSILMLLKVEWKNSEIVWLGAYGDVAQSNVSPHDIFTFWLWTASQDIWLCVLQSFPCRERSLPEVEVFSVLSIPSTMYSHYNSTCSEDSPSLKTCMSASSVYNLLTCEAYQYSFIELGSTRDTAEIVQRYQSSTANYHETQGC